MDVELTPTAVAPVLRAAVLRLGRRLRVQRADTALSNNKVAILSHLAREGISSPARISAEERQHPQSLTRPLAELEAAHLVGRAVDPGDARRATLALSAAGRAALEADTALRDAWLASALASLGADQLALLTQAAHLIEDLREHRG